MSPGRILPTFILFLVFTASGFAQLTKIPELAEENFRRQYPGADNITWYNDLISVNVQFELEGEKMDARYNNKGIWKNTMKTIEFDDLPVTVKDGFEKSKFADRPVTDVRLVYLPGDVEQYRIRVEKNDVQKKHLFYNTKGRLVRDMSTL